MSASSYPNRDVFIGRIRSPRGTSHHIFRRPIATRVSEAPSAVRPGTSRCTPSRVGSSSSGCCSAEILGWDQAATDREIEHYEARVSAGRESQTQPDDRTADAARMGAADVRRLGQDFDETSSASKEDPQAQVVSLDDRRQADPSD